MEPADDRARKPDWRVGKQVRHRRVPVFLRLLSSRSFHPTPVPIPSSNNPAGPFSVSLSRPAIPLHAPPPLPPLLLPNSTRIQPPDSLYHHSLSLSLSQFPPTIFPRVLLSFRPPVFLRVFPLPSLLSLPMLHQAGGYARGRPSSSRNPLASPPSPRPR